MKYLFSLLFARLSRLKLKTRWPEHGSLSVHHLFLIFRTFFCSCCLIAAFPAQAAVSWGQQSAVDRILHYEDGSILIELVTTPDQNCDGNRRLLLSRDHVAFKEMYSAVLGALYSGKMIHGYVSGCDTAINGQYYRRVGRLDVYSE